MARSSDSFFPLALLRDRTFQAREIRRVMKLAGLYLVATTVLVGVFYHQMLGQLLEGMAPLAREREHGLRFELDDGIHQQGG